MTSLASPTARSLAATALSLGLTGALTAQANRVVPATRATTEGNVSLELPFWYDAGRVQLVIAGSAVANTSAALSGFAVRPVGADTAGYPQRTLPNVIVSAGHAAAGVTPTTMATTFTANHGTGFTTVFQGQLVLPPQGGFQSPAPFNIGFLFQQPFPYQRSSGDLLLEIEMPGAYTQGAFYTPLDGEMYRGSWGAVSVYGAGGNLAAGGRPSIESWSDGSPVAPGGSLLATVRAGGPSNPVLVWLGATNHDFLGVPLPLDLGPFGAPGNALLASMDVVTVTALQPAGHAWSAHVNWPIPSTTDMVGATAFAQGALSDTGNALGLVFTPALKIVVAPGGSRPVAHSMLYHHDPTFPIGYFPVLGMGQGPAVGGPVVELRGRFQ